MLALSVRFPHIALIAQGFKTIEVRSWPTKHRGRLLLVSSRLSPSEQREHLYRGVPSGCTVAVVDLLDCRPFRRADAKAAYSRYQPGLYAWTLQLRYHTTAAPVRGVLRLYHVPDDTIRRASRAPRWLFE